MLIATPLGQTVTKQEIAVEVKERGYYPLPIPPEREEAPLILPDPSPYTPAVDVPMPLPPLVTMFPVTPTSIMPEPLPYTPPARLPDSLPSVIERFPIAPPVTPPDPLPYTPMILPDPLERVIETLSVTPAVNIPDTSPYTPPAAMPDTLPSIIDLFPVTPPVWPVSPAIEVAPEVAPEKKRLWLVLLALGALLLLSDEKRKRPTKWTRKEQAI